MQIMMMAMTATTPPIDPKIIARLLVGLGVGVEVGAEGIKIMIKLNFGTKVIIESILKC